MRGEGVDRRVCPGGPALTPLGRGSLGCWKPRELTVQGSLGSTVHCEDEPLGLSLA